MSHSNALVDEKERNAISGQGNIQQVLISVSRIRTFLPMTLTPIFSSPPLCFDFPAPYYGRIFFLFVLLSW